MIDSELSKYIIESENICPVCFSDVDVVHAKQGFFGDTGLLDETGSESFEICNTCMTEFGFDEGSARLSYADLRMLWWRSMEHKFASDELLNTRDRIEKNLFWYYLYFSRFVLLYYGRDGLYLVPGTNNSDNTRYELITVSDGNDSVIDLLLLGEVNYSISPKIARSAIRNITIWPISMDDAQFIWMHDNISGLSLVYRIISSLLNLPYPRNAKGYKKRMVQLFGSK